MQYQSIREREATRSEDRRIARLPLEPSSHTWRRATLEYGTLIAGGLLFGVALFGWGVGL